MRVRLLSIPVIVPLLSQEMGEYLNTPRARGIRGLVSQRLFCVMVTDYAKGHI